MKEICWLCLQSRIEVEDMNVYQNAIEKQVEKDLDILGRNIINNEINESIGSLEKTSSSDQDGVVYILLILPYVCIYCCIYSIYMYVCMYVCMYTYLYVWKVGSQTQFQCGCGGQQAILGQHSVTQF